MVANGQDEVVCSILIPMYNGEKFIEETVYSCLEQTYDKIEIIIIDDYSTDGSYNLIRELSHGHSNITLIQNKKNLGISKTVNIGASKVRGEYLLVLGQDDLLLPNHIAVMLKEFDEKTAFVHCNAELIDKNGLSLGVALNDKIQIKQNKHFMVFQSFINIVSSTGTIICKKYFNLVGGADEKYKNYHEYNLWIKLGKVGKVKYTTKTRAKYRLHDTNITNTFEDEEIKKVREIMKQECRDLALKNLDSWFDKLFRYIIKSTRAVIKT